MVGGGKRAMDLIHQYGMKSMFITTSERAIKRALIRADEVAKYRIAAREKAERLNAVIHLSDTGILMVDQNGMIETFNPAAEKIFGIKSSVLIGNGSRTVVHHKLRHLLNREEITTGGTITTEDMVVTYETIHTDIEHSGTVITCREISKIQQLENQIRREMHTKGLIARFRFSDIQYVSETMGETIKRASYFASTDSTILINGESGTGKELIAQGIHHASKRAEGPFVAINCAALPESLLESELFGYADGAFTGARKGGRPRVFELVHGGTIFLDEIGEISPPIQARLLRVLQEKEVMRVGGDRVIPVNIRIVAATNRNLWQLVTEGKFRSDLYFRVNVLRVEAPPLRNRREDVPCLVEYFMKRGGDPVLWQDLSESIRDFFMTYSWPGNIRQLENIVERYRLSVQSIKDETAFIDEVLQETEPLGATKAAAKPNDALLVTPGTMEEMEKQIFEQLLERFGNNRSLIAESLGISRTTL
jgi:PAS domain S-box-containing protein